MSSGTATVHIVDDDDAVRDSLSLLMRAAGLTSKAYPSASAFLDAYVDGEACCLVTDIRMPGMSGLELQQTLLARRIEIPIIFITGHGDVPMAVDAMKAGAVDFIQKPFGAEDLLDRIRQAMQIARTAHDVQLETAAIERKFNALTPREREVMAKVVEGCANKVIAMDLGVSQRTVELHRARVMQKMGVRSLAELVRVSQRIAQA